MQNRTVGIVATVITAFICGCLGLLSCIWGGMIASGTPFNVDVNGQTTQQTLPATIGYVLLCLSFLMILVPVAVGFFTLRQRPAVPSASLDEPLPPAS